MVCEKLRPVDYVAPSKYSCGAISFECFRLIMAETSSAN